MKYLSYIATFAAAIALSSCSVINNHTKTITVKGSEATVTDNQAPKPATSKPSMTGNVISDRIDGEWVILSVGGKQIALIDEMPYITFEKGSGRFYSSDGCNIINGSYAVTSDGKINFDQVISTMKYCAEVGYDTQIATTLSGKEDVTVKIERDGNESRLVLYNPKGAELMSARKQNMEFINGNWQILSAGSIKIEGDDASIFFDVAERKVHGNTGCNYFNGEIFINPAKTNAIDFSHMACTRMACPKSEQESAILLALEETSSAVKKSDDKATLLDASGKVTMTLRRIAMPESK